MGKQFGSAKASCPLKGNQKATLIVWVVRYDTKALIPNPTISISGTATQTVPSPSGAQTFEQLDAGTYTITVSLAGTAYEKASIRGTHPRPVTLKPGGLEIVEIPVGTLPIAIELLDTEGKGVPDEPFEVMTPDGRKVTGKLDTNGRARVGGILPAGDCKIRFPNRDSAVWEFVKTTAM